MIVGGLVMLVFWSAVIALVVLAIRALTGGGRASETGRNTPWAEDPLEILKSRYARGEIDREEYLQKREDLRG
jgi:putative membrane protein